MELVVNHEPSLHRNPATIDAGEWLRHLEARKEHKDAYLAVYDAFREARRQLREYAEKWR